MSIWHKREGSAPAFRVAKPPSQAATVARQCRPERGRVGPDPPTIRASLGHHQAGRDGVHRPAKVGGDPAAKSCLSIERAEQFPDIDDLGLELDNEQRATTGVPREQVDHAAFAVDGKRHLGPDGPAVDGVEPADADLGEAGVAGADHPLQVAATPPRQQVHAHLEDCPDRAKRAQAQGIEVASLDPRHRGVRHPCSPCHVLLPKAQPQPDAAKPRAQLDVLHRVSLKSGAYPGLIAGPPPRTRRPLTTPRTERMFCMMAFREPGPRRTVAVHNSPTGVDNSTDPRGEPGPDPWMNPAETWKGTIRAWMARNGTRHNM